jgi:DNA-directed RNA polymerase specialized sigma24 family protein
MEISTLMTEICLLKPTLELYASGFPIDEEQSDQLVQDTLIAALMKANTLQDQQTLKHWLLGLMREEYDKSYRQLVPMAVIHNALDRQAPSREVSFESFQRLSAQLDSFDLDLESHERNFTNPEPQAKEA